MNGQSIAGLSFTLANGGVETVKQVRITPAMGVVPEPATWAMMLIGFGAVAYAMRRRRKPQLAQIA